MPLENIQSHKYYIQTVYGMTIKQMQVTFACQLGKVYAQVRLYY